MAKWWQFWKSERVSGKYAAYVSVDPVSQARRTLLWMGPEELSVLKQVADIQGHVDVATPDSGASTQSVSKADIDWAIRVDKLAARASSASQRRQYGDAINSYLAALDEAPGADIYLMSVGSCLAMLRDKQNAIRFLRRAHEINPQNQQIAENLRKCQMS